ncbi:hypothetical protein D3C73_968080 [compost metagenome]
MNPGIEQHISRAAVETGHRFAGLDQAEVAEPADVEHSTIACLFFKECFVKCRNQRRALASGRYVSTAKVADDRDAGQFCEQGRVANLDGEAACRFVADGLAMAANRQDVLGFEIVLIQKGMNAICRKFHPVLLGNG